MKIMEIEHQVFGKTVIARIDNKFLFDALTLTEQYYTTKKEIKEDLLDACSSYTFMEMDIFDRETLMVGIEELEHLLLGVIDTKETAASLNWVMREAILYLA